MNKLIPILLLATLLMSCGQGKTNKQAATSGDDVPLGINIGQRAPELKFESPDGETIALSSLRGQMVLIDFWASWCSPCRRENPNLVKTYHHFKDKEFNGGSGFNIYGVSLDKSKEGWVRAIQDDKLEWSSHVSDLKGWQSVPAAMYHVRGIPANFLIDGEGIIVATNLRGQFLDDKLEELLK